MVTFTTGTMFLLFTCMHFWCGEFYEGVRQPPIKWSAIAESLSDTVLACLSFTFQMFLNI
jgi:hypothetical protein